MIYKIYTIQYEDISSALAEAHQPRSHTLFSRLASKETMRKVLLANQIA